MSPKKIYLLYWAPVGGRQCSEKETVKVYISSARNTLTRSQGVPKKVRGASGRALGRGGSLGPFTLSTYDPDLASDPYQESG